MWEYRAQLLRVVDADSMRFLADTGFGQRYEVELRLIGCWMPELRDPGGPQMRQYVTEWFGATRPGPVWPYLIRTTVHSRRPEPEQLRTFTRWLGAVNRYDGYTAVGSSLNEVLNAELERHPEWGHGSGGS